MKFATCAALTTILALQPLAAQTTAPTPWLFAGSDIPVDTAWRYGVLSNGLHYAVRRNALPAGMIAIRVRIDAGALMETPDQAGYAHLMEHMAFRGTKTVPDGEGIRVWERLGASFGTDTNAMTTPTQTVYQLDLPRNDPASLDTALKLVSEMVCCANIDPKLVEIERKVVTAEREMREPPLTKKIQDASKAVILAGTRAAAMDLSGKDETLANATGERVRAFYERWYRPERATVVMVGDADPAVLEQAIRDHFGSWTGRGPAPAEPDYGKPVRPQIADAVIADPQAPSQLDLVWVSPHDNRPDTLARENGDVIRDVAAAVLSRRFVRKVREGAPFTSGGAGFSEQNHILDTMSVVVSPKQGQWQQSLNETYAILADAASSLPTQEEIDTIVAQSESGMRAAVAAAPTLRSAALADQLVKSVDAGDVIAEPDLAMDIFEKNKRNLTPANIGAAMRTLVQGDGRALLLSPQPVSGGDEAFAAALAQARAVKAAARTEEKHVSLDDLGRPGTPGKIVWRATIPDLGITRVRFANGVELDVKSTDFDKDQVLVEAEVGNGRAGLDPRADTLLWTSSAIVQGGLGPFDAEALERALAGHRVNVGFGVGERAFVWSGGTDAAELRDELRLLDTAIREPRFDPGAFGRLHDALLQNYDSIYAAPASVFGVFSGAPLHDGDKRFDFPSRDQIAATTADQYRAFWQPLFAGGPRRLLIIGDIDTEKAIDTARAIFGASLTKPEPKLASSHLAVLPPKPGTAPLTLTHRGDPDQMLAVTVWSTTGGIGDLKQLRALNIAAQVMQTRIYDRFREAEGGTYTPGVSSAQSTDFPHYGIFIAESQIKAERLADFNRATREIAAALAKSGSTADELTRAIAPIASNNDRGRKTNAYWGQMLQGDLDDPRYIEMLRTGVTGYQQVTADDVRRAAARWLARAPSLDIVVKGAPKR